MNFNEFSLTKKSEAKRAKRAVMENINYTAADYMAYKDTTDFFWYTNEIDGKEDFPFLFESDTPIPICTSIKSLEPGMSVVIVTLPPHTKILNNYTHCVIVEKVIDSDEDFKSFLEISFDKESSVSSPTNLNNKFSKSVQ